MQLITSRLLRLDSQFGTRHVRDCYIIVYCSANQIGLYIAHTVVVTHHELLNIVACLNSNLKFFFVWYVVKRFVREPGIAAFL